MLRGTTINTGGSVMKLSFIRMAVLVAWIGWSGGRAAAFSPYEALIAQGKTTRVGLIAAVKSGQEVKLDALLQQLSSKASAPLLKQNAISNISVFKKTLTDKKTWYWVYFDFHGKDYLGAVKAFEMAAPRSAELVEPHPRAKTYGTSWLQMEWICYLPALANDKRPTQNKAGVVTRLKPEKEQEYRTLHQTVWPGVSDQIARTNNRNLSIFLVEMGDEIYEFLYLEYIGLNAEADGKASKSDPCTLRWWKLTDACQLPLPEVKDGIWAGMDAVVK
jgi:L-rhamnose mutarotase